MELIARVVFKLNIELIRGYPGSSQMALALERDEVQGLTTGLSGAADRLCQLVRRQAGCATCCCSPREKRGGTAFPTCRRRWSWRRRTTTAPLIKLLEYPYRIARPVMAPPKLPQAAKAILKRAFVETTKDPALLADAERLKLDISPLGGDEVARILADVEKIPPATVARYKQIVETK